MPKKKLKETAPEFVYTPMVYNYGEKVQIFHRYKGADGPITAADMKGMVGWSQESEPGDFGDNYLFEDEYGNRIRFDFNKQNRPFTKNDALVYAHEHLNRTWAGPTNFPGETVNGETLVFGRNGMALSAQHRAAGLILAWQMWMKDPHWKKNWPEKDYPDGPVMDALVCVAVSNDPRIVRTLDNVKKRTGTDTLYASGLFESRGKTAYTQYDRKQLCRAADQAVKWLWTRTGRDNEKIFPHSPYLTQAEIVQFMSDHPALEGIIKFLHAEDGDEGKVTRLHSLGHAAGLFYLMAASKADRKKYIEKPTEKTAGLANYDKAQEFWIQLLAKNEKVVNVYRMTFPREGDKIGAENYKGEIFPRHDSDDTNQDQTTPPFRTAALCKAWNLYAAGTPLTPVNLRLKFKVDATDDGHVNEREEMLEHPSVGGIDPPDGEGEEEGEESEESREDMLLRLKEANGDRVLMFRVPDSGPIVCHQMWGPDSKIACDVLGLKLDDKNKGEYPSVSLPVKDHKAGVAKLQAAGHRLCVLVWDEDKEEYVGTNLEGQAKPKPEVKPKAKPVADTDGDTTNGTEKPAPKPAKKPATILRGGTN